MPYAARQGPSTAATGPRRKSAFHPHQFQPPRTTARNGRSVPDEHRPVFRTQKPASVMVLAAVSPVGKSLWFSYTRGRTNQQGNLNRDQATLEQALKAWAEDTHRRQSPDIPAGRGELEGFRPHRAPLKSDAKNMSFLHHQGPVAPIIDRAETYWLHDVVCA